MKPDGKSTIMTEDTIAVLLSGEPNNVLEQTHSGLGVFPHKFIYTDELRKHRLLALKYFRGNTVEFELEIMRAKVSIKWKDNAEPIASMLIDSLVGGRDIAGTHSFYVGNSERRSIPLQAFSLLTLPSIGNRRLPGELGWSCTNLITTDYCEAIIEVKVIGFGVVIYVMERFYEYHWTNC